MAFPTYGRSYIGVFQNTFPSPSTLQVAAYHSWMHLQGISDYLQQKKYTKSLPRPLKRTSSWYMKMKLIFPCIFLLVYRFFLVCTVPRMIYLEQLMTFEKNLQVCGKIFAH